MTSISADGNGRLWERFELANINDRIENIYQYFRDQSSRLENTGTIQIDIDQQRQQIKDGISNQLNGVFKDLEAKFKEQTQAWKDENLQLKAKLTHLEGRNQDFKREKAQHDQERLRLNNRYKSLKAGLDQIQTDTNAKFQDRVKKLTHQLRSTATERDNAIKQAKKEKKTHEKKMNELQEKFDDLKSKHSKEAERARDFQNERDSLSMKCKNLESIIRDNRENEESSLKEQLLAAKREIVALQRQCEELKVDRNKLEDEKRILDDKYKLEKETFKNAIQQQQLATHLRGNVDMQLSADMQEQLRQVRDELNRAHQRELQRRENEWTKAKNESIKTLDAEYKQIKEDKDKEIEALKNSLDELKLLKKDTDDEIKRLKKENAKIDALNNKIQALNDKLNKKAKEFTDLGTELSKYKILWQHFFGLDAPLKDEIERVNRKLDQFENHHNIQSPIPKKKRRIIVESLAQWTKQDPPLILDAIPSPNDEYQRFELYNIDQKIIELKGFKLMNGDGDVIPLDSRQVKPGKCIGVALKKKRNRFDILYDPKANNNKSKTFCNFTSGEVIWLCDSFDEKLQLFPLSEVVYDNLVPFQGEIDSPIFVKRLFSEEDGFQGFEFGNQTNKKIKLRGMCFKNKLGTMRVDIPFKVLPRSGLIRLIVTDDPEDGRVKRNDLVVSPDQISSGEDDTLLLCDAYGNSIELYNLEGAAMDASTPTKGRNTDCFIM